MSRQYDVWIKSEHPADKGQWVQYTVKPFTSRAAAEGFIRQHIPDATVDIREQGAAIVQPVLCRDCAEPIDRHATITGGALVCPRRPSTDVVPLSRKRGSDS